MSRSPTFNQKQPIELNQVLSALTDHAIHLLDREGRVVSRNSGAQNLFGYDLHEVEGRSFDFLFTEEDRSSGEPALALEAAGRDRSYQTEGWRVRKDGSQFWATAVINPLTNELGQLVGFVQVIRDITDQRAAARALERSEEQMRLLVQGVTDYAIFMLDPNGYISNWNSGAQRIKGYTAEEVLGTHFSRFYTESDRSAGVPGRALETAAQVGRFEQEGLRLRKDGSQFFAHVIIDAIRNSEGAVVGFAKVTRDITEKEEARVALQRTEQALQKAQKMETIGKLTGGVAHDSTTSSRSFRQICNCWPSNWPAMSEHSAAWRMRWPGLAEARSWQAICSPSAAVKY